jgi:hypothetical protein
MLKRLSWIAVLLVLPLHAADNRIDVQLAMFSFDNNSPVITPIAILRNGKLIEPVIYTSSDEKISDRFIRRHYPNGTNFEIRQAGETKGSVRIDHFEQGCDLEFSFVVKPLPETKLGRKGKGGLALSSPSGPAHPSFQRLANMDERKAFIDQGRKYLSSHGHSLRSTAKFKIHDLISTKTSAPGQPLLVGSISFTQDKVEYWLFAILEEHAGQWSTGIAEIHPIQDLEDYKDAQEEGFLDQLDIDADGTDEIFSFSTYYEAGSFAAYGHHDGAWKRIYTSHAAGC